MFSREEILALLVGGQMVRAFTDPVLGRAALSADSKIRAILDDAALAMLERQPYRIPLLNSDSAKRDRHQTIREAAEAQRKLSFTYSDLNGKTTLRTVWPLGLIGWTGRWTLLAWCETREDYRNFRFDRMSDLAVSSDAFPDRPDRSLEGYLSQLSMDG